MSGVPKVVHDTSLSTGKPVRFRLQKVILSQTAGSFLDGSDCRMSEDVLDCRELAGRFELQGETGTSWTDEGDC